MVPRSIEERLAALEQEVAEIKRLLCQGEKKATWLDRVTGSFRGDPCFGEILRYGREFRASDALSGDDK